MLELERASIIADALHNSPNRADLEAEMSYNGPGKFEGANDRALVVALYELSLSGGADDSAGSVDETGRHLARFGAYVLETSSQGFVSAWREDSETDAIALLDAENALYPEEGEEN